MTMHKNYSKLKKGDDGGSKENDFCEEKTNQRVRR